MGQVIAAPAGADTLASYTTRVSTAGGATPYTLMVYAWSGTAATGPALYTSASLSTNGVVTVTPGISVSPGTQYIVFVDVNTGPSGSQMGEPLPSGSYTADAFYHVGAPTAIAWTDRGGPLYFSATFTTTAPAPQALSRGAYCAAAPVLRADGTTGVFVDLVDGQPLSDSVYAGATRAFYGAGYGLTCDNLAGLSFQDAGYKVDGDGVRTGNPLDDVYEYFTKP
jgi:hypothetical protein